MSGEQMAEEHIWKPAFLHDGVEALRELRNTSRPFQVRFR